MSSTGARRGSSPQRRRKAEHRSARPGGGILTFFWRGIEHILTGLHHLLFSPALLLRGGDIGSLLAVVTAFTVAHSITLALALLDVVSPPASLVEPVIALSIVYVAAENMFLERAALRRWAVGFAFGLHGFGFAGALLELELPTATLAGSLLSFNLGVEAGQGMVISILLPALMAHVPAQQVQRCRCRRATSARSRNTGATWVSVHHREAWIRRLRFQGRMPNSTAKQPAA